jgi:hypothetical protein
VDGHLRGVSLREIILRHVSGQSRNFCDPTRLVTIRRRGCTYHCYLKPGQGIEAFPPKRHKVTELAPSYWP